MDYFNQIQGFVTINKETIAIVISCISFLTTLFFATITQNAKSKDTRRSVIGEYYDTIKELVDVNEENNDLMIELREEYYDDKHTRRKSIIREKRDLFLSRADILLGYKFVKPTDISLIIIAGSLSDAGRHAESVLKYKWAFDISTSKWAEALNRRSYGQAVILAGNLRMGRTEMLEASKMLENLGSTSDYDEEIAQSQSIETIKRLLYTQIKCGETKYLDEDFRLYKRLLINVQGNKKRAALEHTEVDLRNSINKLLSARPIISHTGAD